MKAQEAHARALGERAERVQCWIRWMMSRAKRLRPGPGRDVRRKIQALAKLLATVASSQPASDLQKKAC